MADKSSKEELKTEVNSPVSLDRLRENFKVAKDEYLPIFKQAKKLDMTDSGKLWEAIGTKYPTYQVLPDTNWISYTKENIVASVYSVGKTAKILPTSEEDKEIVTQLNVAMEQIWGLLEVAQYQMQAGERAALLNYGVTQVGWDNSITSGTRKAFKKGDVVLKNIDPLKFMRDPFADSIQTAGYCMVWDDLHKSVLLDNPKYSAAFKSFLAGKSLLDVMPASDETYTSSTDRVSANGAGKKDYYRIFTHWVNDAGRIHEIHTVNNEFVLYVRENIQPATFPFAELYCNLPANNLFGSSPCAKVFSNVIAYNLMASIVCTAEYKNQRPPRFINNQSGLNIASFTKHGNDADRTFVVQGDASKAVHYHQFPAPTQQATTAMQFFGSDIQTVSGVDGRYTGRDTGSILTTGGISSMLDQVTMIDAPKVNNYELYCKRLTHLILSNYLSHSALERNYFVKDKRTLEWNTVTVKFPDISADTVFAYEMAISSELPKNKARIESVANHLMEMQMQYQGQGIETDIITPEEWLMCQDLPMSEYMLERMGIQRTRNWQEVVAQVVTQFATLAENGVSKDDAIAMTADTLDRQARPGAKDPLAEQLQDIKGTMPQQPQQGAMPPMM